MKAQREEYARIGKEAKALSPPAKRTRKVKIIEPSVDTTPTEPAGEQENK
jgi:hypothetical protein